MSLEDLRRRLRERRGRAGGRAVEQERDEMAAAGAGGDESFATVVAAARQARRRALPEPPAVDLDALRAEAPLLARRLAELDPWQVAAVLDPARSLLLRAQVGSGKTTVLVAKLLALIERDRLPAERIAVMTFTNKAAAEIRDRVSQALGGAALMAGLQVGTFHGHCRSLLRRHLDPESSGRSRAFRLLDERSRLEVLRELIARDRLRIAYAARLDRRIERWRAGEALFGNMKRADDIEALHRAYEDEKRRRDLVDFDDLIALGRETARTLPAEARPAFIVVDEFQDSDPEQLALLEDWRGADGGLFAVGDPDQVIYSWRGGSADLFDDFARRFGGRELRLPRNYRSSETILEAARFVLGPLAASHDLVATRAEGAGIVVRQHHDPVAEARHIATSLRDTLGLRVGILVRTREQMEPLREQLEAAGLTVRLRERRRAEDPLATWFQDHLDGLAGGSGAELARSLGHPVFGFPGLAGRRLEAAGADLATLLERWLPGSAADRCFLIETLTRARVALGATWSDPSSLLRALGIEHFLEPRSSRFEGRRRRVLGWLEAALVSAPADWLAFLRDLLVLGDEVTDRDDEEGVELMTMHAAKGLEFDRVFISGANRGMIPLASSWGREEEEAEERRLLFVAMTRARDELEIGWFSRPPRAAAAAEPSPWLALIPDRLLRAEDPIGVEGGEVDEAFGPGVLVRHPRYGEGVVLELRDGQVRCRFPRGERSFSLTLCPLEIID
ncbi:MAG: ATP-dependent helicase [Planctomycetes bacterium]|nr:ATP-dependent helicase [Planctomycetota bacterium]